MLNTLDLVRPYGVFTGLGVKHHLGSLSFCPLPDGRKGPAMKKQWMAYAAKYP